MRNTLIVIQCDGYKLLNGIFSALTDSFRNFSGFSKTGAYVTVSVTN